jgi:hypothetical protein
MRALKLTYLLPLVISLTTAPEGCASLGLLSQSIVIVTKASMRLRNRAGSRIADLARSCGIGQVPRERWSGGNNSVRRDVNQSGALACATPIGSEGRMGHALDIVDKGNSRENA